MRISQPRSVRVPDKEKINSGCTIYIQEHSFCMEFLKAQKFRHGIFGRF